MSFGIYAAGFAILIGDLVYQENSSRQRLVDPGSNPARTTKRTKLL